METGMWEHPATRDHVAALRSRGATFVGPASGRLASGASGAGRMAEQDEIRAEIERILSTANDLAGVRVLVTAGPTFEAIDPVRFIGNRSSGKMGYAVAQEARDRGAHVVLVSGPSALQPPAGVEIVPVESHQQMSRAVLERARDQDVIVMAAAIADFAPAQPSDQKLKRQDALTLELTPTSDISAEAVAENPDALHIGFALETGDLVHRAQEKMLRKGQDMVVANGVGADHNPFGADTNRVAIITREGITELPERSKRDVARHLWDVALRLRPQLGREHCSDQ
jgi:phosphopantothenoylcysteine decarboxylase/phosphopantothenate--cysteine ligase